MEAETCNTEAIHALQRVRTSHLADTDAQVLYYTIVYPLTFCLKNYRSWHIQTLCIQSLSTESIQKCEVSLLLH